MRPWLSVHVSETGLLVVMHLAEAEGWRDRSNRVGFTMGNRLHQQQVRWSPWLNKQVSRVCVITLTARRGSQKFALQV